MRTRASYTALAIAAGQLPADNATPWWSDANKTGILAAQKATLDCSTLNSGNLDTVIRAHTAGKAGNDIGVTAAALSAPGAGVSIAVTSSIGVVISFEAGVSKVSDLEAAIAALAGADQVIEVGTPGTAGHVLTVLDQFGERLLTGGTDAVTVGLGHLVNGLTPDEAIVRLMVSNWGAVTELELQAERTDTADGSGGWERIVPPLVDASIVAGSVQNFIGNGAGGNKITISDALGTTPLAIRVPVLGAARWRFGFRDSTGAGGGAFACTASVDFVQATRQ